jgi:hypothetical protein
MNQHSGKHNHENHGHSHEGHHHPAPWYATVHRNWIFWVAVLLMLVAMGVYVMSLDESLQPDGNLEAPVPEAAKSKEVRAKRDG